MNNRSYRLVFSKLRGMWVAVAETAVSRGKAGRGETPGSFASPCITLFAMRHAAFAALTLFSFAPVPSGAQIVPSGAHAPDVISTANGVPQVNVQKPSGAGVSMNTYSQFDVQKNGAILNNSPVIVNTQLAGQISGNPNFGPNDAARIIVNQVSSNNPSQLRGYVEVAGQRTAAVVIANGSGLVIDGGGFINTSRGILTTGNPLLDANGNLTGFNVTQGNITVQGEGFNASNLDQVDLIARAVQVNAAIYGNTLDVVTGANDVDYSSLNATPVAGRGATSGVSIDVSQLGGMYANRITLVGTEHGVGVANAGTLAAQAGDLTLTASGQLVQSGRMSAGGNITIEAERVANSGTLYAQQNTTLASAGALTNSGTLAAQQDMSIAAGSVASTGLLGAGINRDGTPGAGGNLRVSAAGRLSATGQNVASGRVTLDGVSLDLSDAQTWAGTALELSATGGNLSLARAITGAGSSVTLSAAGTLDNSGGTLNAPQLAIQAGDLTNHGGTIAGSGTGTLSVSTGSLSNDGGTIATNGALSIQGESISNRGGTLAAQSSATLHASSLDNGAGGQITAQAVSIADTGAFTNTGGTVQAGDTLGVTAQTIANDGGTIVNAGTGATTVTASGTLTNTAGGLIGGNGDVSVSAGRIDNRGGSLVAGGALSTQSGSTVDNTAGLIQAGGDASVTAQGAIANAGGQIGADGALRVSGASLDNTSGRVANTGTGATTVSAGIVTNRNADGTAGAGVIGGNGDVTVSGQFLSNTGGGQIVAGHDLTLNETQFVDNSGGTLSGTNDLALSSAGATVSNANGSMHGNGAVSLDAASLDNTSGRIGNDAGSGGSVTITTGTLANQNGAIGSDRNLTLTTDRLTGEGTIIAGQDGAVTVNGDYTHGAASRIQANHDLTFTVAGNLTSQGGLAAVNALTVSAANVDNQAGGTLNAASTTLNAAGAITSEGRIEGDAVTVSSATLTNTATIIGNTVTLNASQSIANAGAAAIIAGASGVNLYSPGDISNTGGANIYSLGDVAIAADATRDARGYLANRADSVTNDQSTLQAQGNVEIAAQTLTNTRPAPDVETVTTGVSTVHQTKRARYMACATMNADGHSSCTQAVWDYGYRSPVNSTFSTAQVVSETSGPKATDNVLVVSVDGAVQTVYYNTLTNHGDGTITVSYWDDYDPNINFDPATEYPSRSDAHNGYQRVEIARDTTTTTQQDRVTGSPAQQGQLLAGGNMKLANVGTLNNLYSGIAAGGSIQIGSTAQDGPPDPSGSGSYGGTLVNNVGQTLYQYQQQDIVSTYAWNENTGRDVGTVVEPSVVLAPVAIGGTGGTIIANRTVSITGTDISNTNVAAADSATGATGGTLGANQTLVAQPANAPQTVANGNGALDITLPTNGLYAWQSAPDASYLVETDPRFTSYAKFISSDYLLNQLGLNPQTVAKRLGDGLYEQQLVQNQITQLTGRVYLQGYDSAMDEYTALMTAGVNVAQAFGLQVGVALSAAQMDALTGDIVWLVSQTVTLPDGTTQDVLVPQVYLAQTHANDLQPAGALVAADDVALHATGDVTNSGTIRGGTQTVVTGTNIVNRAGTIAGSGTDGTTVVSATNDVVNASGLMTGNRVAVLAGHDIVNTTLVDATGISPAVGGGKVSQTLLGAQGTIASTGDMVVAAGNDLTVHGANLTAGGSASVSAGHDLTVDAVQSVTSQSLTQNANRHWESTGVTNETSAIIAGGDLVMQSGNDMTFRGAQVTAGGDLAAVAGSSLSATTVTDSAKYDNVATDSRTRQEVDHTYDEQAIGTSFTAGGNATLGAVSADASKGNVTLTGSSLTAGVVNGVDTGTGAANIAATGNVTLNEAREEHDSDQSVQSRRGSFVSSTKTDTMQDTRANVGVGSLVSGDTVNVQAGKDLTVQGSSVVGTNDVSLAAKGNVNITTSQDTVAQDSYYHQTHSGISASGLSVSIGKQSQSDTSQASSVTNNGSIVGSLNGNLNITAGDDLHAMGSVLHASQDVTMAARTVTIDSAYDTASQSEQQQYHSAGLTVGITNPVVSAIQTATQMASAAQHVDGDPRLLALAGATTGLAAKNAYDAVGGDPVKAATTVGINVSLGASSQHSSSTSQSSTAVGSTVSAGRNVTIAASGTGADSNINVIGSTISAGNDALLAAEGNVNLEAAQNTASQQGSSSGGSVGVGVSLSVGSKTGLAFTAAASGNRGNADGDSSTWTNTHVVAGNTLAIQSGGDTNLVGAVASGNQVIADVGGNLNIQSLQDTDHYDSKNQSAGVSVSVCVPPLCVGNSSGSVSASREKLNSNYASVNEQSGIRAGDGGFQVGVQRNTDLKGGVITSTDAAVQDGSNHFSTGSLAMSDIANHADYHATGVSANIGSVASLDGGLTPGTSSAGFAQRDGSASSVTSSGISGIAGNASVRTGDQESGIKPIFDLAKVQSEIDAQVKITQQFGEQASTALSNYVTGQRTDLQQQLKDATDPDEKAQIQGKLDQLNTDQRILNVLIGVVSGQVTAAVAQGVLSEAADLMRQASIQNSALSPGVVDSNGDVLSNLSGGSPGVDGDGVKLGGTRLSLDSVCGPGNVRCATNPDGSYALNNLGQVQLLPGYTVDAYLASPDGKDVAGLTGGIQGATGTLAGIRYPSGGLVDQIVEAYAGTHDFIGGELPGYYDELGNTRRAMSSAQKIGQAIWSDAAIIPATPFAMATLLPPQVWNAIAAILQVLK